MARDLALRLAIALDVDLHPAIALGLERGAVPWSSYRRYSLPWPSVSIALRTPRCSSSRLSQPPQKTSWPSTHGIMFSRRVRSSGE